jgi:[ribosomal protein S18]-alanine N-acetyltransferase
MAVAKAQPCFEVGPMHIGDMADVLEIERVSFPTPWTEHAFLEEMTRDFAFVDVVRDVALGRAVAFGNYWLIADEVHLLNIATHPQARRVGHASRLLAHITDFGRRRNCRFVTLEVRRSNAAAQRLYRRFGFCAAGVRPNYYAENQEDAILMLLDFQ